VQDEWRIAENHLLTPGLRIERISRRSADHTDTSRSASETGVNPSLHYLWAFARDTNLRASIARKVKQPKFDQLNPYTRLDKGVLKGGNPDLRAERALGYELGLEHFFWGNRGVVGANLYRRDVRDYIQKETRVEDGVETERPFNVGRARFHGIEFDWRIPLLRKGPHELNLTGNHSEMRGKVWAGGKRGEVKDMPERMTNLGLDWYHRPSHVSAGIHVNYQPEFTRKGVNDDGVQETKTRSSATLLDAYVGKRFGPQAELRLIAKNLLSVDKDERTVKYNADGSFNNAERKVEKSSPMVMVTFESRF
jgi:outer membrane receptor for ferrienterochelin and colicins